jgi:hypothetical protein
MIVRRELRRASNEGTLRAFRNADRFSNFQNLSPGGLQPQDIARLIEEFFRLAGGNSRPYGCQGHEFAFGDRSR